MAFTEMYGFETKDGQQARVDLSQIRSVLPSGSASGYVKAVLDGGNSVTVKGTVDGVYDLIVHYCGKRAEAVAPRKRFVSGVGTGVGHTPDVPQVNAVATQVVSLEGKEVGVVFDIPQASRGTDDAYQRLGARLVSRIPESLRRMTYERPNDAWQTESPRSLLKRISEETDHVLSCMLSGQYTDDVWSQLADVAAAAFLVGDSYEAKRWAPTSADGSGL